MKTNKKLQHQQRQILDQRLLSQTWKPRPKIGWLKSVRNALGISTRQLAELMKVSPNSVSQLETSEVKQTATLKNLVKAAAAMDCDLIYWLQPKSPRNSFDEILEQKALSLARKISKGVAHSMSLEEQKVTNQVTENQIKTLAQELKRELDPRLWQHALPEKNKK
jgi:predicted DNA-binding mobile mystery protein A